MLEGWAWLGAWGDSGWGMAAERSRSVFWSALAFEAGLGMAGWALARVTGQTLGGEGGGLGVALGLGILATLPMLAGFAVIRVSGWAPLAQLRAVMERVLRPVFSDWSVLQLGAIALAAGIGEELLFRGFLQPYLANWMPSWCALVVASIVFGLAHPLSVVYATVVGVIGVYLGALYMVTGDLVVPMVTHAVYDGVALVWFLRGRRRGGGVELEPGS